MNVLFISWIRDPPTEFFDFKKKNNMHFSKFFLLANIN